MTSTEQFHTNCKCACHNMWEQIPPSFYIITLLASVQKHFHGTTESILDINLKKCQTHFDNSVKQHFLKIKPSWGTPRRDRHNPTQTMRRMTRNGEKQTGQLRHLNYLTQWNPYSMNVWGNGISYIKSRISHMHNCNHKIIQQNCSSFSKSYCMYL